jgi:hypothetical protein
VFALRIKDTTQDKRMIVIIACDVDPDRPQFGGTRFDIFKDRLAWRGVERGIPALRAIINSIRARLCSLWRSCKEWWLYSDSI